MSAEPEHDAQDRAPERREPERRDAETREGKTRDGDRPPPPRARLALLVAVPLVVLLAWGVWSHWAERSNAVETRDQARSAAPEVHVATAKVVKDVVETTLPGQTLALNASDLFARATGFVAERHVDIGSHVRKGDLLLRIAAPDLDQELAQARAQLGQMEAQLTQAQASLHQAQSNASLSRVNSERSQILAREGWDTKVNRDTQFTNFTVNTKGVQSAQAAVGVAVANIRAQQATVDRLVALTGYEQVTAPFDGVITQRDVEVGDLVSANSSSGTALFHIDNDSVLRCQVYVPQSLFVGLHEGLAAKVTVPEMPGRSFKATVSRSSSSLAQNSRSMLVEVDIDNRARALTPGLFVNVSFDVPRGSPIVSIPDAALIFDQEGLHVAAVKDGHAKMTPIVIERDMGTMAELRSGLAGGEQVIVNPPTDLRPDQPVKVLDDSKKDGAQRSS